MRTELSTARLAGSFWRERRDRHRSVTARIRAGMTVDIERALLRRAIRAAGGYARFAAGLGISRQTISYGSGFRSAGLARLNGCLGFHATNSSRSLPGAADGRHREGRGRDGPLVRGAFKKRGSVAPIIASRSYRRGPVNGLQDQSTFLRITSRSPSTPVLAWLLVSPAANPTDARYAGISRGFVSPAMTAKAMRARAANAAIAFSAFAASCTARSSAAVG